MTQKKDRKTFSKPYIVEKEYKLKDLLYTDDPREKADVEEYVGKYVLKRMSWGQRRVARSKLVGMRTQLAEMKNKHESGGNPEESLIMNTDLTEWQNEILIQTIVECPKGKQKGRGWSHQIEIIREFIFGIPEKIGEELLEIASDLNENTAEDQKN